ncbi:MAG: carbohydrate binding domain-containing protein [Thermoguttaceae bacterium]
MPTRPFPWLLGTLLLAMTLAASARTEGQEYPNALPESTAAEFAPLFPFKITHGSPDNITNIQTWDGPWKPAGQEGFVKAVSAQFVTERGPRYFTGTNICFSGCFPEHAKAEQVAADLARFGINLVRLHYVHHPFPPAKKYASPDSFIEPVQLEKFDYLFHQLKQRGIYVYMQLNIARKFGKESGFENADQLPWYNNGIDNIEPRMISLQKKYVRDLLTHVNPYTGRAYKDEPAIAMLELANENSVVVNWYAGKLDHLPSPYQEHFQRTWNDWLAKKYQNTAQLRKAWQCRMDPLGADMIPDGSFAKTPANAKNYPAWGLQHDGQSQGDWTIVPGSDSLAAGNNVARLTIRRVGKTPNIPQFFRRVGVTEAVQYNLSFKLRASKACQVSVRVSQDHDPWHTAGFRATFGATEKWQEYSYRFIATMTDPKVRLVFADFAEGATVEIGGISLRPGGVIGLAEDETLEARAVPLPKPTGPSRYHLPKILADMSDFLFDCEDAYFQQMARVVKDEVKAPQPVAGTQLNYGFCYPVGKLDYCDIHNYWSHPTAPGGGNAWTNPKLKELWFVGNAAMVNRAPAGSTIAQLAIKRILNRPYTVSEYDHPYPNFYATEGNLMLFALAAFQNWNGILHFAWTHGDDYDPQVMTGYFDMKANTVKQIHYPACYAMFTRGDVRRGPGKYGYTLEMSQQQERAMHAAGEPNRYRQSASLFQPDASLTLAVFAGMNLTDLAHGQPAGMANVKRISSWQELPKTMGSPAEKWVRNEFGELYWNYDAEKGGYFTVDTPSTKVFTGFVRGRSFAYQGLTLQPGKTRLDWTTISLVKAKGATSETGSLTAGRYLLAASGLMQNTGTVFKKVPPDRISTAKGYGGVPGTAPILCEGIPATLTLNVAAAKVKLFALDQAGNRAQEVPVRGTTTETRLEIGPQYQTLWYELVID